MWRFLKLVWLSLLFVLSGCTTVKEPRLILSASLEAPAQELAREGSLEYLLVDDVDANGRPDLLVVSHGESFVRIYRQLEPRSFEVGPAQKNVGFHPDRLGKLPGCGTGSYMMNAEGVDRLLVMQWDADDGLEVVAGRKHRVPFASVEFQWPGWGNGLAVVPYSGMRPRDAISRTVWLLRGLDCETAAIDNAYALTRPRDSVPGIPVFTDVDGDGIGELFYATHRTGSVWMVRYPGEGGTPQPELVHQFRDKSPRQLAVDDLNRDGFPDLLVPLDPSGNVGVLLNDGKGVFTYSVRIPLGAQHGPKLVRTAVDKDGARYIAGLSMSDVVLFRFVTDSLQEYERLELHAGGPVNDYALLDVDGDGWLDVVVVTDGIPLSIFYGPLRDSIEKLSSDSP